MNISPYIAMKIAEQEISERINTAEHYRQNRIVKSTWRTQVANTFIRWAERIEPQLKHKRRATKLRS